MIIGILQLNFKVGDFDGNLAKILLDHPGRIDAEPADDVRDLHDALILGTQDYVVKAVGAPTVLVALSGGIDSAVTAYVASRAVGPENVMGFGMPSPFSSAGCIEDARMLAENLGIGFELIPIGSAYEQFGDILHRKKDCRDR